MKKQTGNQRVVREYVQRGHIQQADNSGPITQQKLRVAAYARVSTDEAEQLCKRFNQVGIQVTIFEDKAFFGKEEWDRMMNQILKYFNKEA